MLSSISHWSCAEVLPREQSSLIHQRQYPLLSWADVCAWEFWSLLPYCHVAARTTGLVGAEESAVAVASFSVRSSIGRSPSRRWASVTTSRFALEYHIAKGNTTPHQVQKWIVFFVIKFPWDSRANSALLTPLFCCYISRAHHPAKQNLPTESRGRRNARRCFSAVHSLDSLALLFCCAKDPIIGRLPSPPPPPPPASTMLFLVQYKAAIAPDYLESTGHSTYSRLLLLEEHQARHRSSAHAQKLDDNRQQHRRQRGQAGKNQGAVVLRYTTSSPKILFDRFGPNATQSLDPRTLPDTIATLAGRNKRRPSGHVDQHFTDFLVREWNQTLSSCPISAFRDGWVRILCLVRLWSLRGGQCRHGAFDANAPIGRGSCGRWGIRSSFGTGGCLELGAQGWCWTTGRRLVCEYAGTNAPL